MKEAGTLQSAGRENRDSPARRARFRSTGIRLDRSHPSFPVCISQRQLPAEPEGACFARLAFLCEAARSRAERHKSRRVPETPARQKSPDCGLGSFPFALQASSAPEKQRAGSLTSALLSRIPGLNCQARCGFLRNGQALSSSSVCPAPK